MRTKHFKTSSFYVMPNKLNANNTLFGGEMMKAMDLEMAKVAQSVAFGSGFDCVVTARFEEINFLCPANKKI
jgi:acyl-CoA hydrolase